MYDSDSDDGVVYPSVRVILSQTDCIRCGRCSDEYPDLFGRLGDDYQVRRPWPTPEDAARYGVAAGDCPADAITLEEEQT